MSENIVINDTPVYVSKPDGEIKGGLIIIHEIWGLNDHTRDVADRYAKQGYLVYAPDVLSDTRFKQEAAKLQQDMFNPEKREETMKKMREVMAPVQAPEFALKTGESLKRVFDHLYNREETKQKVAVLGFCFGGTYSFGLAVAEPRLIAAVPYYGHADQPVGELKNIQARILAFYGEKDEALVSKLPDLENRMHEAGVDFSYKVYPNCAHAFFNDTNPFTYNEEAAKDSWNSTQEFLESVFAS